jgi:hypothetical protein
MSIDGSHAQPRLIDDGTPALGGIQACRRVARTIFLASAPSVAGQTVRGCFTSVVTTARPPCVW